MPFVRIDTLEHSHDAATRVAFGEVVYRALRTIAMAIPARFSMPTSDKEFRP